MKLKLLIVLLMSIISPSVNSMSTSVSVDQMSSQDLAQDYMKRHNELTKSEKSFISNIAYRFANDRTIDDLRNRLPISEKFTKAFLDYYAIGDLLFENKNLDALKKFREFSRIICNDFISFSNNSEKIVSKL